MIAPTARRRDALKKALRGKPGASLWRFAAASDLSTETFLHSPIFHPCEGEPAALVKPPVAAPTNESTETPTSQPASTEA